MLGHNVLFGKNREGFCNMKTGQQNEQKVKLVLHNKFKNNPTASKAIYKYFRHVRKMFIKIK